MIESILATGLKIIDKIFPNPAEAAQAKVKLLELEQNGELAKMAAEQESQRLVNQTMQAEYASTNKFKSSWRPLFGYVMALSFAGIMATLIFALIRAILYDPSAIKDILEAVVSMFFAGFTVLGVSVYQRSKDKRILSGQVQTSAFEKLSQLIKK